MSEEEHKVQRGHFEPFRRPDREARQVFVETDRAPEGLAASRIGIEHIDHHGQPLRHVGSSYRGDTIEHRFTCTEPTCGFVLAWQVTS